MIDYGDDYDQEVMVMMKMIWEAVGVGQARSSVSTYIHFSLNLIIAPSMINVMMRR